MAKLKKVRRTSTRPGEAEPVQEREGGYYCSRCGKHYHRQKNNFPASQSTLYRGNGAYLTICNHCFENLFEHYREVLGGEEEAIKRMCLKFDIYWSPEIYKMVARTPFSSVSRIKTYVSKSYLMKFIGKTYDDTLDEAAQVYEMTDVDESSLNAQGAVNNGADDESEEDMPVDPNSILFWGSGFTASIYKELDMRFERWTKDVPKPMPQAEESLYRQICLQEFDINRKMAANKNIEQGQNALNNLLGSLNVKPNQIAKDEDKELDGTPLGVWVKRWEEHKPIPDDVPDPSIIKYITTWFFGHLGKAFNLKNVYSQMYDDAMNKYRVEMPDFENESDDDVLANIFGGVEDDGDSS